MEKLLSHLVALLRVMTQLHVAERKYGHLRGGKPAVDQDEDQLKQQGTSPWVGRQNDHSLFDWAAALPVSARLRYGYSGRPENIEPYHYPLYHSFFLKATCKNGRPPSIDSQDKIWYLHRRLLAGGGAGCGRAFSFELEGR